MKVHKVGTLTLGITLVIIGIIYLAQTFFNLIPFKTAIQIWPAVFILLGIEILVANSRGPEQELIYDKAGIMLTIALIFFAMILAILNQAVIAGCMIN